MDGQGRLLLSKDIRAAGSVYSITLEEEDLSRLYPGMIRFTLRLASGGVTLGLFRTNTYEYSPTVPLDAEQVIRRKAGDWERELLKDPERFVSAVQSPAATTKPPVDLDILVIQGSPRADGNCGILAGWVAEVAASLWMRTRVEFLDDLSLRPCIGCYQCYNTGSCTFDDDMTDLIGSLRAAPLVVICTPVYTNTVPGGLKIFIDRCQAFHAERSLFSGGGEKKGILLSVAGRKGQGNFTCVKKVVASFMRNLGIRPSGELLVDGMDTIRDIRAVPGIRSRVGDLLKDAAGR